MKVETILTVIEHGDIAHFDEAIFFPIRETIIVRGAEYIVKSRENILDKFNLKIVHSLTSKTKVNL